jgi:hypothetical protein
MCRMRRCTLMRAHLDAPLASSETGAGIFRTRAACPQLAAADISPRGADSRLTRSKPGLKFRRAAVSSHTEVCYPVPVGRR